MPKVIEQDFIRTGHYLVREVGGYYAREEGTIASGAGIVQPGTVLGRVTATGKYVPVNPAGADGSESASAILFHGVDATDADVPCTVTARSAEVQAAVLIFPDGTTDPQKTAAIAQLGALGIVAR